MESWLFEDKKTWQYFRSAQLRLCRRLLKLAPHAQVTDEELLAEAQQPDPDDLMRLARLRYLGLLYKCETATPWALFRADQLWCALLRTDLHWLWTLIARTSTLQTQHTTLASGNTF